MMWSIAALVSAAAWLALWAALAVTSALTFLAWVLRLRRSLARTPGRLTVAFFHPYSNAGGGGERVLWCGVQALQQRFPHVDIVVYTGYEGMRPDAILAKVAQRFGVTISGPVRFVFLRTRSALEEHSWLRPTMLMQSLGSMLVGLEAAVRLPPDVAIDSMGYAFVFPVFRLLAGARVGCYVHYPTISTDMLELVFARRPMHNNSGAVQSSLLLARAKYLYYRFFAWLYGAVGSLAGTVMVNSSWTEAHIRALWGGAPTVVFPPCDVATFAALPLSPSPPRTNDIVTVGQYRPEKDHSLMVQAFARAVSLPGFPSDARLITIGSVRGAADEARVAGVIAEAAALGVGGRVVVRVDVPFAELVALLGRSRIGLHAMWNEHFGIAVVEYMAAGLVAVAHDSAGPRLDIVRSGVTGRLATTVEQYAEAMAAVLREPAGAAAMAKAGRESVQRFDEMQFAAAWSEAVRPLVASA